LRRPPANAASPQPTTARLVSALRGFILFHGKGHPLELRLLDAIRLLERVVRTGSRPLPALENAWSALRLPYGTLLGLDLGKLPAPPPR